MNEPTMNHGTSCYIFHFYSEKRNDDGELGLKTMYLRMKSKNKLYIKELIQRCSSDMSDMIRRLKLKMIKKEITYINLKYQIENEWFGYEKRRHKPLADAAQY